MWWTINRHFSIKSTLSPLHEATAHQSWSLIEGILGPMSVHSFHLAFASSFFVIDLARYQMSTWRSISGNWSLIMAAMSAWWSVQSTSTFTSSLLILWQNRFTFLIPFMRSLLSITLPRASCAAHHLTSHFLPYPSSGGSGPWMHSW